LELLLVIVKVEYCTTVIMFTCELWK